MRHPILARAARAPTNTLCPLSLQRGRSYAQNETQKSHLQRISWLLVTFLNATLIALRRYRLFEEERNEKIIVNNSDFRLFQVGLLRKSFRYYHRLGQPISSSKCLWTLAFAARRNYRRVNANTLIGAAILFHTYRVHPIQ